MLKIGDFSKLAQISVRMLRHYDALGLLIPKSIDPFTGYRYYQEEQLTDANRIKLLKGMGFPLAEVAGLLPLFEDGEQLRPRLLRQRETLAKEEALLRQKQRLLESTLERIGKDEWNMKYTVAQKTLPHRCVASVRQVIPTYAYEGRLWHIMMQETAPLKLPPAPSDSCMAIMHDESYVESNPDVEIQMVVDRLYPPTERVSFLELPALEYASVTFQGDYGKISEVSETLVSWMRENNCAFAGPMFNIYHTGPHETQNPDEWVTEVCVPIRKC